MLIVVRVQVGSAQQLGAGETLLCTAVLRGQKKQRIRMTPIRCG